MQDEFLITFDPPIVFDGKSTDSLTLREPTVAQVEQADKVANGTLNISNMRAYQQALVMAVSGKPRQIIGQMRVSDMNKAFDYLMGFITGSPTITET
jgi:hypothetical protein